MTWNTLHLHLQEIRNARTERQTKEVWDVYLKQRKEMGKKNGKGNDKKDSKK